MGEHIPLIVPGQNTLLADSRAIAQALGMEHERFLDHVTAYQREIERRFGMVRFEIVESEYYALLTEDQALVYLSYSQQMRAKTYKQTLGRAFARARDQVLDEHDETEIVAWALFLAQWHAELGESAFRAAALEQHLRASTLLATLLPESLKADFFTPRPASSFAIRFGRALGQHKGIPLGPRGWILQREYDRHDKACLWRVVATK